MANEMVTFVIDADDTDFKEKVEALGKEAATRLEQASKGLGDVGKGLGETEESASGLFGGVSTKAAAMAGAVGGLVSSMATAAIGQFQQLASEAMAASDSTDKFRQTLDFAGIDTSTIDDLTQKTQDYADKTVYGLSDIRNITAQLASNGVQGPEQLAEALGNVNAASGGTADTYSLLGLVLTQTNSATKLTGDNWRQFSQDVPGAAGQVKQALSDMGAYTGDFATAMENGEISSDEFNQAIMNLGMTDAAQQAATSTQTFEGSMGQLQASVVGVMTDGLDLIKPGMTGFINSLSSGIDWIRGVLSGASGAASPFVSALSSIDQAFMSGLQPALTSVQPLLSQLMQQLQTFAAVVGPPLQQVFTALQPMVAALANVIGAVLGGAINVAVVWVTELMEGLNVVASVVMPLVSAAVQVLAPIFTAVFSAIASIVTACTETVSAVWTGVLSFLSGVPGSIEGFFSGVGDAIVAFFQPLVSGVTGIGDSVASYMSGVPGRITSAFSGIGDTIVDFFASIPGKIADMFANIHVPSLHVDGSFNLDPLNFSLPTISFYANGAYVDSPTMGVFGEAGGEYLVPRDPTYIGQLAGDIIGMLGGMAASGNAGGPSSQSADKSVVNAIGRLEARVDAMAGRIVDAVSADTTMTLDRREVGRIVRGLA